MKKTLFFFMFCIFYGTLFSQEKYRIETDYITGETVYLKMDKNNLVVDTLGKPKFKRNSTIQVVIKNANPFAVSVQTKVEEKAFHSNTQGFNLMDLLGSTNMLSGNKLALNLEELPISDGLLSRGPGGKTRGEVVAQKLGDLNQLTMEVSAMKTALIANLSNPKLGKEDIIKNLMKYASIPEHHQLSSPDENFYLYLMSLERAISTEKESIINEIGYIAEEVDSTIVSRGLKETVGKLIDKNKDKIMEQLKKLMDKLEISTVTTVKNVETIEVLYSTLENASFDQTFEYVLEAERVNVELNFTPSTILGENVPSGVVPSTKMMKLSSKGGFKINTGIALAFNNLTSPRYYIDENGFIGEDRVKKFVPNLGTMINFYPIISDNFNIGGTVGVAVPLSADIKGINFLLGPSFIIGSENRVTLSGGVSFGPVNRLTNGLEPGMPALYNSIDNFVSSTYDFGYFFGLSFNIINLKK